MNTKIKETVVIELEKSEAFCIAEFLYQAIAELDRQQDYNIGDSYRKHSQNFIDEMTRLKVI